MTDPTTPDAKTKALFDLLDLSDPAKRQTFVEMGSAGLITVSREQPAHFRLDCMTAPAEEDQDDAELA